MSIQHIKIYQIYKAESVEFTLHILQCLLNTIRIVLCPDKFCNTLSCKNIVDLTDTDHIIFRFFQHIQHRIMWRLQGKIMASGCPCIVTGCTNKRPRNDSANPQIPLQHPPGNLAIPIQFFHRNHILMCCNLKYRIRRRINDQCTTLHMLVTVVLNDLRAGIRPVTQYLTAYSL